MACKTCGKTKSCGCGESGIQIPEYSGIECSGEKCSEVFCDSCIMHCQPDMSIDINNKTIIISQGERLDSIIQKVLLAISGAAEGTVSDFKINSYTSSSVELTWTKEDNMNYNILVGYNDNIDTINVGNIDKYEIINLQQGDYTFQIETQGVSTKSVKLYLKLV